MRTISAPFDITLRPPGSKSLTNRALLLAALAEGESVLRNVLIEAEDSSVMIRALQRLGARIERRGESDLVVTGVRGEWRPQSAAPADLTPDPGVVLCLENAGTATRFLTAAAVLAHPSPPGAPPIPIVIDGNERMRQRPIGELVDILRQLGVHVEYVAPRDHPEVGARHGYPPIAVYPPADRRTLSREIQIGRTASSQFISALLLVAPFLCAGDPGSAPAEGPAGGLTITFVDRITSWPYVAMTLGLLEEVGIRAHWEHDASYLLVSQECPCRVYIPCTPLYRFDYDVEPDASGATYFWAAAALVPGASCTIPGLDRGSLQGDAEFAIDVLLDAGADAQASAVNQTDQSGAWTRVVGKAGINPIVADFAGMPDAAMTAAAVACFASGPSRLSGLRTLRVKETDRIAALQTELARVGVKTVVDSSADDETLIVIPPPGGVDCSSLAPRVVFETYNDHRMAMSLALIGLRRPNVFVSNPACVAKTYPNFWRDFSLLYTS
ncbi:MAG: 3-phosphoshikimate 1-carboxyvinyltransferase [Phycisphaerales bacterium]